MKRKKADRKPKVTVLAVAYNEEHYLKEMIESVLSQTFEDYEFIIVDNNADRKTKQYLHKYSDPRIVILENKENLGPYKAANQGLEIASGKYVARIDGDDICLPNRLEEQYSFLKKYPANKAIGSWTVLIDEIGAIIGTQQNTADFEALLGNMFFGNTVAHSALFFERSFVKKIGNYRDHEFKSQDYELYFRIIENGGQICNLNKYLILHRIHGKSITGQLFSDQERLAQEILHEYIQKILGYEESPDVISAMRTALSGNIESLSPKDKLAVIQYAKRISNAYRKNFPDYRIGRNHLHNIKKSLPSRLFQKRIFQMGARLIANT